MDPEILRAMLGWCTLINYAMLLVMFMFSAFAADWMYGMHRRFYPISRESFNVAIYSLIGAYKLLILVFNLVPWIALLIVT